jgi:predicted protein tyrosine phosphatase
MDDQLPSVDILSRDQAAYLFCNGHESYDHVVSISDARANPPAGFPSYPARSIALFFDDFAQDPALAPELGYDPPEPKHMEAILRFAKDIGPGETVLCHCNAGISRSSAAAAAILASKVKPSAKNAQAVIAHLLKSRSIIHPNKNLIWFADEQLGYEGSLVAAHAATFLGDVDLGFIIGLERDIKDADWDVE